MKMVFTIQDKFMMKRQYETKLCRSRKISQRPNSARTLDAITAINDEAKKSYSQ